MSVSGAFADVVSGGVVVSDIATKATGVLTAVAAIGGSTYGIIIAAVLALIVLVIGFFVIKFFKNREFEQNKSLAAETIAKKAVEDNKQIIDNRDKVDDFLGRPKRSDQE
jgi:uncharacterized membrane protein